MSGEDDPKFLESEDECDYVTPNKNSPFKSQICLHLDENMESLIKKTNMKSKEGRISINAFSILTSSTISRTF